MLKSTNYYAAICKKDAIHVFSNLPDCCYPVAAVLRKDTCCIPIMMDDKGKLYCRLEVATRSLSAFPSDLVIADVYVGCLKPTRVITREDSIHDIIGGAVIPQAAEEDVLTVSEFADLF